MTLVFRLKGTSLLVNCVICDRISMFRSGSLHDDKDGRRKAHWVLYVFALRKASFDSMMPIQNMYAY